MRKDKIFWAAVLAVLVGVVVSSYVYIQRAPLVEIKITELTPLQEQQLNLFIQRVSVLLTVATLVVGGAGALLLHFWEQAKLSSGQQRWAAVSLLASGVSVYFGYVAYDSAIWMLGAQFFNLETAALRIPSFLQLLSSGLAIFFLVLSFLSGPIGADGESR